jgi:hypothetical protein
MIGSILTILAELLVMINRYLDQEAQKQKALDAEDDAEAQNVKNQVKALGDSVSATMGALDRLRSKQQASEATISNSP